MKSCLLCILTSSCLLSAPNSCSKHFFGAVFHLFCSFQMFSVIFCLKSLVSLSLSPPVSLYFFPSFEGNGFIKNCQLALEWTKNRYAWHNFALMHFCKTFWTCFNRSFKTKNGWYSYLLWIYSVETKLYSQCLARFIDYLAS